MARENAALKPGRRRKPRGQAADGSAKGARGRAQGTWMWVQP